MSGSGFLTPEAIERIEEELRGFRQVAKARVTFLIDRNGQLIGQAGETNTVDATSLGALTASNIAASKAIADLLGEAEFGGVLHEGEETHIHVSLVGTQAILVVVFDAQTSIGLVRLRVKPTARTLADLIAGEETSESREEELSPFAEITDEDIDQLFG
ncbi:MAG: roadblock/LC7 domain-containing protein [Leptospirillia bacterium]